MLLLKFRLKQLKCLAYLSTDQVLLNEQVNLMNITGNMQKCEKNVIQSADMQNKQINQLRVTTSQPLTNLATGLKTMIKQNNLAKVHLLTDFKHVVHMSKHPKEVRAEESIQ